MQLGLLPLLLWRRGLGSGGRLLQRFLFQWQWGRREGLPFATGLTLLTSPTLQRVSLAPSLRIEARRQMDRPTVAPIGAATAYLAGHAIVHATVRQRRLLPQQHRLPQDLAP